MLLYFLLLQKLSPIPGLCARARVCACECSPPEPPFHGKKKCGPNLNSLEDWRAFVQFLLGLNGLKRDGLEPIASEAIGWEA